MAYDANTDVEWSVVNNHNKYAISNTGLLYSHKTNKLIGVNLPIGYRAAEMDGKKEYIHRLVAQAFIPNPSNFPCINHKDENRLNNNVDNLEWCDKAYNNRYGTCNIRQSETKKALFQTEEGLKLRKLLSEQRTKYLKTEKGKRQIKNSMRQIKCLDIETLEAVRSFPSFASTNDFFGKRTAANIQKCCSGKIKSAYGYKWSYA